MCTDFQTAFPKKYSTFIKFKVHIKKTLQIETIK